MASRVRALAAPRPSGVIPSGTALARAAVTISDSATKSSAYAQDAAFGADFIDDLGAEEFTVVSLAKRFSAHPPCHANPYHVLMSHTVVAELVAAVMSVEVEVGDRVASTDAVVILESMKMEIPVLAEVAGLVGEILVSPGDVVNDGDPLVVIT